LHSFLQITSTVDKIEHNSWVTQASLLLGSPILKRCLKFRKKIMIIKKKIWPEYFQLIKNGKKTFELRQEMF